MEYFDDPARLTAMMEIRRILFGGSRLRERLDEHRPALYRVAYAWCHDHALADDLVQETLLKALSRQAQLRDAERLRSWLFAILSNGFRDHLRRQRLHDDVDELADSLASDSPSPEDRRAAAELSARVRLAVARLPVGQRQVVTLVDLEEFSYAEVAEVLGIPIGTVMSRLCRARAALRESLVDERPAGDVIPIGRRR